MSKPIPSSFSRFDFTDAERVSAAILTTMQKQHVHNLRVEIAETLLQIEDDVNEPMKHVKERAKLHGLLDAYAGLINLSESAEETFRQLNQGN